MIVFSKIKANDSLTCFLSHVHTEYIYLMSANLTPTPVDTYGVNV